MLTEEADIIKEDKRPASPSMIQQLNVATLLGAGKDPAMIGTTAILAIDGNHASSAYAMRTTTEMTVAMAVT